jgi:cytochrome oxidase Cu insertion factor (SCO1/SenC/PrrC family)
MTPAEPGLSPAGGLTGDSGAKPPPRRSGRRLTVIVIVAAGLVFAASFAYLATRLREHQAVPRPLRVSGIPSSVPTSLANLMQLSPVQARQAPGFTLADQRGHTVSLASFEGRAVVLEFMDPHCVDICPLVSQEFIDAYHDLGATARRAVFVAVNVNPFYRQVADVAAYSRAHQLTTIPSWYFLTGPLSSLRTVWQDYAVTVQAPRRDADIVHTSVVYFIDPRGQQRYVAVPMGDHTANGSAFLPAGQLSAWGRGIALVTRQLVG